MIKRKRKQFFFTESLEYNFPKENQRTHELIERPHILGIRGIGVKSKGLPKFEVLLFLNFSPSRYTFLFFVSKILDIPCYLT